MKRCLKEGLTQWVFRVKLVGPTIEASRFVPILEAEVNGRLGKIGKFNQARPHFFEVALVRGKYRKNVFLGCDEFHGIFSGRGFFHCTDDFLGRIGQIVGGQYGQTTFS